MTAHQTPTPGIPLSAESVKLLVKGDVISHPKWGVSTYMPDTNERPAGLTGPWVFIGRPDAEGWMTWSGGENPVPGKSVFAKFRSGVVYRNIPTLADCLEWGGTGLRNDIIAFRLTTPSDQGDEVHSDDGALEHLSVEAPVSESIGIHAMTGPVATEYLRARGMKGVTVQGTVVVLNADGAGHSFADAPMTLTTPASGSDGLIERLRVQKVIPSGPVDGNLWMPRNPDGSEAADALEAAEKRIGELEDRLSAEIERHGSTFEDFSQAQSQVAALKAALDGLLALPELVRQQEYLRGGIGTKTPDGMAILQALALKEGR
jgi:hypothetical protein